MKKTIALLTLITTSLCVAGCSQKATSLKGLLYEVSGNGLENPSYLFGTHHLAPISFLNDIPGFWDAYSSTEAVVGELIMTDMAEQAMMLVPHMIMPEGKTYSDMLSEDDYRELDEALKRDMGVGLDQFATLHPAALSTMWTQVLYARAMPDEDFSNKVSIDQYLQDRGRMENKKVIGLETVEDQIYALFYSEPIEIMAESLVAMAKHPEYYEKLVQKMNEYYFAQDLGKLYEISFENPDDPHPISEDFGRILLKDRNDNWLAQLPQLMEAQPCFVAVGAAHLPAEDGLIEQLRSLGYTVAAVVE